jgi:hypothetical protein
MRLISLVLAKFTNSGEGLEEVIKKVIVTYFSKRRKSQKMQQKDLQQLSNIHIFELDLNLQSEILKSDEVEIFWD